MSVCVVVPVADIVPIFPAGTYWHNRGINTFVLNPFRAPKFLLILNSSKFVNKKGFPVVKAFRHPGIAT